MGATFIHIPELVLTENESKTLAKAIEAVTDQYDFSILPEKYMVWVNLAVCAGGIYGPRIGAHLLNQKRKKESVPFIVAGATQQTQ
jgi:hypothetical protein